MSSEDLKKYRQLVTEGTRSVVDNRDFGKYNDTSRIEEDDTDMSKQELEQIAEGISTAFDKYFPNGWSRIGVNRIIGDDLVSVTFGLVSDKSEQSSGLFDNDPMLHKFLVRQKGDGTYVSEKLLGYISTNPEAGSYMAMSSVKTPYRKTTGNPEKIIKSFDVFFGRLKTLLNEHESNIYGRERYSDKWFS